MDGKKLRRLRQALGMTLVELGRELDLHWNTLARQERNEIPVPRTTLLATKYLLLTRKKRKEQK